MNITQEDLRRIKFKQLWGYEPASWEQESFSTVCPNAVDFPPDGKLEAVSLYQTIDLLCEGEVAGLCDKNGELIKITSDNEKNEDGFKGIYLNDVAIKNTNANTLNYTRVFADFRVGTEKQRALSSFQNPSLSFTNSIQTLNINVNLPGLNENRSLMQKGTSFLISTAAGGSAGENSTDTGQLDLGARTFPKVRHSPGAAKGNWVYVILNAEAVRTIRQAEKAQVIAVTHTVTNDNCTDLQVDMKIPGALMYSHSDGKISPSGVNFCIKTGYVDDELTVKEKGSVVYRICGITGKTSGGYARSYNIKLPPPLGDRVDRFVKIFRTDAELGVDNVKVQKGLAVGTISEIIQQKLTYPHSTLMGMLFDGRGFSSPPTRRFDCKMTKVFIPNNYDPETRFYNGNWDGSFAVNKEWTDNPAWIFYDIATNKRYGIAKYGFKADLLDIWNLYTIAKYCDQLVPTGFSPAYKALSFTVEDGGVIVTIDDSSEALGEEALKQRFPEGGLVCLYETQNAASADMDKAYRRIIIDPSYSGTAGSDGKYTFKIVKQPSVEQVFQQYPAVKSAYLESKQKTFNNASQFLIDLLVNQQSSTDPYVSTFLQGEPLDPLITKGTAAAQFREFLPLLEPRFSCNIYLDAKQNAYNALNDIAAIFRGMIYWSSGYLYVANDQQKNPVMLFTNANVKDGNFVYSGSASTARSTAIQVRYNDASDSYKPKVEYVEDAAGIREYGYSDKEVFALGVTSKGQAHRLAKWMLYTTQTETDTVQFLTGQEGSYLRPSDVVKIQDKLRTTKRYGGRITAIDHASKKVTLDHGIEEGIVGQKITFIVPKSNKSTRDLDETAQSRIKIAVENHVQPEGLSPTEIDAARQPQIKQFTIAAVEETNVITVSETTDEDFNLIKVGYIWSAQNTSADYEIEEVEYRVISVVENSSNEYQVTGMMYNSSKFGAVDRSKSVESTQQSKSLMTEFTTADLPDALSATGVTLSVNVVTITSEMKTQNKLPTFNARFDLNVPVERHLDGGLEEVYLELDIQDLADKNGVTPENTGGYVVEVNKADGEKVRFALDGYDQTESKILLGSNVDKGDLGVTVFRYSPDYTMEDLGLGSVPAP